MWSQTHNLILTDATGAPVLQSAAWPAVQLTVSMQVPVPLLHYARGAAQCRAVPYGCTPMSMPMSMSVSMCSRQLPPPLPHAHAHAPMPQRPYPIRQVPLLYWAERRQWMWHKKWTLPKLHVRVTCDGRLANY